MASPPGPSDGTHPASSPDATAPSTSEIDYTGLYEEIKTKPCHVASLERQWERRDDILRTKQHIIDRELERVYSAKTLEDVHTALEEAGRNLQQLQVFRRIDMLVTEEPENDPEACTVVVDLEERNWYKVHAATYLQGQENTVEVGLGLHNVLGRAEHLRVSAEYGSERSSEFALNYEQHRLLGSPLTFDARVHQHTRNHVKTSSFAEELKGLLLGLKSADGSQSLQYELGWRTLSDPSRRASRAVVSQTGDYLKSALKYSALLDTRNAAHTQGWAVRSVSEVCGLGAGTNLQFGRQQLDLQALLPVVKGVTLNLTLGLGAMLPWGGSDFMERPTCIADRFFLGGPSSLRGFKYRGVGPTDLRRVAAPEAGAQRPSDDGDGSAEEDGGARKRDALGGDLYASVFAALQFQLPQNALRALRVHFHLFVNGGNNILLTGPGRSSNPLDALRESAQEFGSTFRWSAGAGFVLPTWFGRFEANYVAVLSNQESDRLKRGIQLGFASNAFMQ